MKLWEWIVLVVVFLALSMVLSGCSSLNPVYAKITPEYDKDGRLVSIEANKFLADIEYSRHVKYDETGLIILEEKIEYKTDTNADDILSKANSVIGKLTGVFAN
jgi:hypothetical protein